MRKISYLGLIASMMYASLAIAQYQPMNGSNPQASPSQAITPGGAQPTIVDQNGSLKIVTPDTKQAPTPTNNAGIFSVPQMPEPSATLQNKNAPAVTQPNANSTTTMPANQNPTTNVIANPETNTQP